MIDDQQITNAYVTLCVHAGIAAADVTKRMGHSVETLVSTYVGALEGDEAHSIRRVDIALVAPEADSAPKRVTRKAGRG